MAGSLSKYFYAAAANKTCRDFTHPNLTCGQATTRALLDGVKGSLMFYFPACFIPLLFKINDWNKLKTWKDFLKSYGKCFISGYFVTSTVFVLFCFAFNTLKRFYLPYWIWLPSSIGAIFCGLLPEKMLHIDSIGLFNMYVEFVIKQSKSNIIVAIRKSRVCATLIYSLFNAIIMCSFLDTKASRFWFSSFVNKKEDQQIGENDKIEPKKNLNCYHHDGTCAQNYKKEITKSIQFAFGLGILRTIIPRFKSLFLKPLDTLTKCVTKFDYGLFAFLVSSNGLFKYLFCQLNQRNKLSLNKNCFLAGLAAGLSYWFYPKYIIFTWGLASTVEMLCRVIDHSYDKRQVERPAIIKLIKKLPKFELLYMFSIGMMFQIRVMYPHLVNSFVPKMMNIGSVKKSDILAENYAAIMMGLK
ncbi:unnamed protein product [Diamesa serratosioi]